MVGVAVVGSEGWAGSVVGGLCLETAEGLTGSGEGRPSVAGAVVGDGANEAGTANAGGEAVSAVGTCGAGSKVPGVAGPPQAATTNAMTKATANGMRFSKGSRYV